MKKSTLLLSKKNMTHNVSGLLSKREKKLTKILTEIHSFVMKVTFEKKWLKVTQQNLNSPEKG